MRHCLRPAGTALVVTLLSACSVVGPNYQLPEQAQINRPEHQGEFSAVDAQAVVSAPLPADWWRLYDDPALNDLVQQALVTNSELRVAAANLARARAELGEANARGGFEASASAGVERTQVSGEAYLLEDKVPVANIADAGINLSYQFDLFGTLQRGIEAAQADAEATQAAADTARITVVADVVRAYAQICAANEERAIAEHSLALQQQSLELAQRLHAAGRGTLPAVTRSETQFKSLRAELPRFEAERQSGIFQLAMLLGEDAGSLPSNVTQCDSLPQLAQRLPVGDGTALLKRRPDIRQAERQLAAATARIGVATGELYPTISLGASTGLTGIAEHLGQPATQHWGIGPLISWTLPANGARQRVQEAQASSQAALARFDGVVLNAVRETETGLARYSAALETRDALVEAQRSAKVSAEQTHRFFIAGRESALADLAAARVLSTTHAQLADAQAQVAMAQIDLFLALGGGWQKEDEQQTSTVRTTTP
ncbi:efflux transporter outer membrane subunit [Phytohalomonas tamaricis]|uniref:efflux transporter outer membrane subunit n=1 Tax=Phytohalomonas tamaricis TaxID=2081032 RepID=UPI000D0B8A88|nr:efflux transporter outer membrane subunit [Phytohalomonas tamaricis]